MEKDLLKVVDLQDVIREFANNITEKLKKCGIVNRFFMNCWSLKLLIFHCRYVTANFNLFGLISFFLTFNLR